MTTYERPATTHDHPHPGAQTIRARRLLSRLLLVPLAIGAAILPLTAMAGNREIWINGQYLV